MRGPLVVLACLSLSGCLVGPDYVRAPTATPPTPAYKETSDVNFRPALPRDTIDRGPWWKIYGDPTLDQLMAQVDVSNQTLKESEAAYRQAIALIRQSQSSLYPTIGYTGSTQQTSSGSGIRSASGTVSNSVGQFSAGASLSWEIDLWGRIRRTIESDQAAAQASAADLAAARLSAQSTLATSYFGLRISDRRRRLLEESTAAFARSMNIVRNQMNAGTASRLDFSQAQAQYEQTRAQLVAETVTRAQFEHAIAALTGRTPAEVSIAPAPEPATVPTIDAGIPSALLERRPDIAAAERTMASANAQVGVAQAAYYPDFTFNASINFASTVFLSLFQIASSVWSLGPQVAGTAIDGGSRAAQVESARANYDKAVATYRQTVLTAFQQVEDGLVQQRVLEQQEQVQQAALAAAREAERISLNQYQAGTVAYTTVVTAQTTALNAEQTLINVRLSRLNSSATLVTALGGGWSDVQLPPLTPIAGVKQQTPPPATPVATPAAALQAPAKKRWWWPF
ncbi:MAG TPA: efflux transporter outer membrane subunit [Reyranella sp.]|jgi:NodT family efflux transporter outer membrane factor (OMF) lipoprotein|nr:efflux transporter outer membrane subunit [Reyranella sp.]